MEVLIEEIDALYVEHAGPESPSTILSREQVQKRLTVWSKALLESLPAFIQEEVGAKPFYEYCVLCPTGLFLPTEITREGVVRQLNQVP